MDQIETEPAEEELASEARMLPFGLARRLGNVARFLLGGERPARVRSFPPHEEDHSNNRDGRKGKPLNRVALVRPFIERRHVEPGRSTFSCLESWRRCQHDVVGLERIVESLLELGAIEPAVRVGVGRRAVAAVSAGGYVSTNPLPLTCGPSRHLLRSTVIPSGE